jgi:hypothetical protein
VTRGVDKKNVRKKSTRAVGKVGAPRDLARYHLLRLAAELRADAERSAIRGECKLETPRPWLRLAADVLAAVADGDDPRKLIDGNAEGIPRILAFEAVLDAIASGAGTWLAAFDIAADRLQCHPSTIEKHLDAELKTRCGKRSDYLVFSGPQKRRPRDRTNWRGS